jgi:hypothetical protein
MSDCFDHMADAYEDLLFGRTFDEGTEGNAWRKRRLPISRTCKFCGAQYLQWHKNNAGRWVLCKAGTGIAHECKTDNV